jgi:DNA (cytosine-5)-methyltransferase 1
MNDSFRQDNIRSLWESMKELGLFAGIGGFSLGLNWAGIKTVAFCEKDKGCWLVLKKHWPV